jgi:hypothetical protein
VAAVHVGGPVKVLPLEAFMRAVNVEHAFAGALGIPEGQRDDVNDADYVRSGKLSHLTKAIAKTLPLLKKRAELLNDSDPMKRWVEVSLSDLEEGYRAISHPAAEKEITKGACIELWSLNAISIRLIDRYLAGAGC